MIAQDMFYVLWDIVLIILLLSAIIWVLYALFVYIRVKLRERRNLEDLKNAPDFIRNYINGKCEGCENLHENKDLSHNCEDFKHCPLKENEE